MASIKLKIFFFHLLILSYVFAEDPKLADIECPCKDGKVMNCEGGHRMGGGLTKKDKEPEAPAPDAAGGGDCAGKDGADAGAADAGKGDDAAGGGCAGKDGGGADAGAAGAGGDDAAGADTGAAGGGGCAGKDGGGADAGAAGAGGDDAAGADTGAAGGGGCAGKDGGGADAGAAGAGGDDAAGADTGAAGGGGCAGKDGGGADAGAAGAGGDDAAGADTGAAGGGGCAGKDGGGADAGAAGAGGDDAAGADTGAAGGGGCAGKDGGGADAGAAGAGGDDAAGADTGAAGGGGCAGKDGGGADAGAAGAGGDDAAGADTGAAGGGGCAGKDGGGADAGAAGAGGDDAAGADTGAAGGGGGGGCAGKDGGGADAAGADAGADDAGKGGDAGGGGCKGGGKDAPAPKADEPKAKDGSFYDPPLYDGQEPLETEYKGEWMVHNKDVGVNAMQFQLMPNSKAVWIDTTNLGPSKLELGPKGNCPPNPDNNNEPDCFAHGIQYDVATAEVKTVYVRTDPWCSSGHMLPNGDMLSTGGNRMGDRSVRLLKLDDPEAKFVEREQALGAARWYASNCVLEDGGAVIVGGRDSYSYDVIPPQFEFQPTLIDFPFLQQTTEPAVQGGLHVENNLYPFIFLIPDGNVFIFANDRAVRFNPMTGEIVKEYPVLEGGSRNYPTSGQGALLPLRITPDNAPIPTEVVVCGGNKRDAFPNIDARYTQNRVFSPALSDCNRIQVMADNPTWQKEQDMPSPRTMGDLLALPNAEYLFINGAKKGTSGWDDGEDPNLTPTVYMPDNEMGQRFKELKPTDIPRMYHSSSAVLPDTQILVCGSNAHQFYTFDGAFPTELRTEKFSPHYLDPKLDENRPAIEDAGTDKVLKYGQPYKVTFTIQSGKTVAKGDVLLTLLYPPFTTHGFSQNQRMIVDGVQTVDNNVITAVAPADGKIAPPGYYMMFVNYLNVPSQGIWVHID